MAGNERTAETDSDKAHTLADFVSSVYTVEDNGDFEYLPTGQTDVSSTPGTSTSTHGASTSTQGTSTSTK